MVALAPRSALVPAHPAWSWRTHAVAALLRSAASGVNQRDPVSLRRSLDRLALLSPPTRDVRRANTRVAHLGAEWITPQSVRSDEVVLHLHGGGYATCSLRTHRGMLADLARATGRRTLAVEYRKAPEFPFPIPIDDCTAAYQALLAEVPADRIVLSGDSAGGALALSVVQRLRAERMPLPKAMVLLSPWVDLRGRGASVQANRRFDYITPEALARFAELYLQGADPDHPEASPSEADFDGFPPMLVQVGGGELLRSDIERMAHRARAAGVDVRLQVWDGMFHAWHGFSALVPEAKRAFAEIGRFVDRVR